MNPEELIGKNVQKISGKTFKHGGKISSVAGVTTNLLTGRPAFTFKPDDSNVECIRCELVQPSRQTIKVPEQFAGVNPRSIWNSKQNHPELVVQDATRLFNLTPEQQEAMRFILMNRGVNKWLRNRLLFIDLKHEVKEKLKQVPMKSREWRLLHWVNARMQNIAKSPRWVEWGRHVHKKMPNNERELVILGNHT